MDSPSTFVTSIGEFDANRYVSSTQSDVPVIEDRMIVRTCLTTSRTLVVSLMHQSEGNLEKAEFPDRYVYFPITGVVNQRNLPECAMSGYHRCQLCEVGRRLFTSNDQSIFVEGERIGLSYIGGTRV